MNNSYEAGDSQHFTKKPGGYWKIKKLADGTRVPMFVDGSPKSKEKRLNWENEKPAIVLSPARKLENLVRVPIQNTAAAEPHDEALNQTRMKTSTGQPPSPFNPEDIIKCPLCYDPMIEATSAFCGHVFCYECIHQWAELRNWCPICQEALIDWWGQRQLHRVYAIDNVIENHLATLAPETRQRFMERRANRLASVLREYHTKGLLKYVKGLHRRAQLYIQSKGFLRGIERAFILYWRAYVAWIFETPTTLVVCFLLAYIFGLLTCNWSPSHFLAYVWNAILKYPGGCDHKNGGPPRNVTNIFAWLVHKFGNCCRNG